MNRGTDGGAEGGPGVGRAEVLSLIDFLGAYDARRNPPVRDIARYDLYRLTPESLPGHPAVVVHPSDETWLTVDFLDLPPAPPVPAAVADRLTNGADVSPLTAPVVTDDPDLASDDGAAAVTWIDEVWWPWSQDWSAVAAVKALHRDLFEQRERLVVDRDTLELVWGFGRLRWDVDADRIVHPMITVPVEIDLDPVDQRIRVRPAGPPDVESRYLHGLDLHDRNGLLAARQAVTADGVAVWSPGERDDLLRRLVRSLDDGGTVGPGPGQAVTATVDDGWVLFLRRRVPDAQGFLDDMRELYGRGEPVPAPLASIVDAGGAEVAAGDGSAAAPVVREPERLLLPLDSNEEQERILEYAQRFPGVVVQGPPGTGKSHTIANLISHHVAYGRRVLVVAEKEQSLRVLADKVPAGIRDLIVSVLGADEESRRRVEAAVNGIQTGVTGVDPDHADREIARLTAELDAVDRGLAEVRTAFLRARTAETVTLPGSWAAGDEPTPQVAAGWLADHPELGLIPDRLTADDRMPDPADFAETVRLLGDLGLDRAHAAVRALPDPATMPDPALLRIDLDDVARGSAAAAAARAAFSDWDRAVDADPDVVTRVLAAVRSEARWRSESLGDGRQQLLSRLQDPLQAAEWHRFAGEIDDLRARVMSLRAGVRAHEVHIPDDPAPSWRSDLQQAHQKLAGGGRLGLFARDARRAVEQCTVDGHVPASAEEVQLCLDAAEIQHVRRRLTVHWSQQTAGVVATLVPGPAEESVHEPLRVVHETLAAGPRWAALAAELRTLGLAGIGDPTPAALAEIEVALAGLEIHLRAGGAARRLHDLVRWLRGAASGTDASPLFAALADDLTRGDLDGWRRTLEEARGLRDDTDRARRLLDLSAGLRTAAPLWLQRILDDPAAAGDPARLAGMWQWRQLQTWVDEVAVRRTPAELQAELTELLATRRRTVVRLVGERAWRLLADNLGRPERQALTEYLKAAGRYGKTGGKFAQRWINEMRSALDRARTAVPVWIMPTAKALTSFRPGAEPPFDVLIVDEASQIGFHALPLLSLARTAVVVGDDKQTSPENVGLDRQQIFDMMDDHLRDLPGYRLLFDPDNSLYDLALQRFSTPIMLTEHFRCLPDIIAFSNRTAYENRIIPLRDQPPSVGWAPLGRVRVRDGYRVGDLNVPEAEQVVALLERLHADPAYDGMGFGVVSLLGTTQAAYIQKLLYDRLGPKVYEQRRIRCGDAAVFQGDERDVMVISTVVAKDPTGERRIGAMTSGRDLRRINVAASRAQNQMWVVTSVDATDLPAGDLRAELIRHCTEAARATAVTGDLLAACESDFERRVVGAILARGYRGVEVQRLVGRYRIDIVVNGPERRLAVECDGDRWHGDDVWHRDRARQEVLERAGWSFERIRGSAFYRDPEAALEPLWARLDALGIPTGDEWLTAGPRRPTVLEVGGTATGDVQRDTVPTAGGRAEPAPPVVDPVPTSDEKQDRDADPGVEHRADPDAAVAAVHGWLRAQIDGPPGYKARLRAAPTVAAPQEPGRTRTSPAPGRAPYREWTPVPLPSVTVGNAAGVRAGLAAIVAAEGPMYAETAFRRYVQAAGGARVGREIQRLLVEQTELALRQGLIARLAEPGRSVAQATLHAPGGPSVVVRERGPRALQDIPRSEIAAAVDLLGTDRADVDGTCRAVLAFFGSSRLTAATESYLRSCLD